MARSTARDASNHPEIVLIRVQALPSANRALRTRTPPIALPWLCTLGFGAAGMMLWDKHRDEPVMVIAPPNAIAGLEPFHAFSFLMRGDRWGYEVRLITGASESVILRFWAADDMMRDDEYTLTRTAERIRRALGA